MIFGVFLCYLPLVIFVSLSLDYLGLKINNRHGKIEVSQGEGLHRIRMSSFCQDHKYVLYFSEMVFHCRPGTALEWVSDTHPSPSLSTMFWNLTTLSLIG